MPQLRSLRRGIFATRLLLGATLLVGGMTACTDDDDAVTAPVINTNTVVVTPRVSSLRVGQTQQLAATLVDKAGATVSAGAVTWKSSEPTIATVSSAGLVTMLTTGSTAIQATINGVTGLASFQGVAAVASISVTPFSRNLRVAESLGLSYTLRDASGNALLARPVTFTSSAPTVATVSADGVVTGIAAGSTTITVTSETRTATYNLTVEIVLPVNTVTVGPLNATVAIGGTQQLTATTRDANNAVVTGRTVTWSTLSAASVGTVSATGLVSVLTAGSVVVNATSEGKVGTVVINPLLPGTPLTITGALNSTLNWFFEVPAGTTSVVVATTGAGTQDPDLFVYRPGATTAACASELGGPNETCTITTTLTPGLWRASVIGYTAYSAVTLRATIAP
ncbi:Ig domain-containing protein [Gemmatimonas sp.]|uniref:Ig-like domain-containing protein n=1 Tax=Gemmatimonas sp. TaxID=1962908 RepID=UPI0039836115